jgi:hypothetical protein
MSPELFEGVGVTEGGASGTAGGSGNAVTQTLWFTLEAAEKVEVALALSNTVQGPTANPVTNPLEVTEQFGVPNETTAY